MERTLIDPKEIELFISLSKEYFRVKMIFFDNIIELLLYEIIQNNSFDDLFDANKHLDPEKRIALFSFFNEKVQYCVEKGLLHADKGKILTDFHGMRNNAYHQAFNGKNQEVYIKLTELLSVVLLELIVDFKASLKLGDSVIAYYCSYIKKHETINADIVEVLKNDLSHRLKNLKDNLVFMDECCEKFDENKHRLINYQQVLDHIVLNYGIQFIERAKICRKSKVKHLKLSFESAGDYIDSFSLEGFNQIVTVKDIANWIEKNNVLTSKTLLKDALETWISINEKLSLLEEIIDYYIWVAC